VWDALIWRYVQHVDPSGCSQQAHLLRNYPPYILNHAEPLDPSLSPSPALLLALSSLSLFPSLPAVATAPAVPLSLDTAAVADHGDAPEGFVCDMECVDAAEADDSDSASSGSDYSFGDDELANPVYDRACDCEPSIDDPGEGA
jgi:hypothetical protein